MKIFVATFPFGACSPKPLDILNETGWEIIFNNLGRRLKKGEVQQFLFDVDGVIAGTEPYDRKTLESAKNLKVISRVGVGLDNIDFDACKDLSLKVTYTPEAPADGVADLTLAQIINLLRGIHQSDQQMRQGIWHRVMGRLVSEIKIGILGVGRIGKRVVCRLRPFFGEQWIYACDLEPDIEFGKKNNVCWLDKLELFQTCDLVTIHIPMNKKNYHCVGMNEMRVMKKGGYIINTSRGPILDENALLSMLINKHLAGAALDVFAEEPYKGPFIKMDNVALTAHIGASAKRSRYLMELGAAVDCINVLEGRIPNHFVTREILDE